MVKDGGCGGSVSEFCGVGAGGDYGVDVVDAFQREYQGISLYEIYYCFSIFQLS